MIKKWYENYTSFSKLKCYSKIGTKLTFVPAFKTQSNNKAAQLGNIVRGGIMLWGYFPSAARGELRRVDQS